MCGHVTGLIAHKPEEWGDTTVHKACKLLSKLNHANALKEYGQEYVYYKTISPWLQVKILRLLQYYAPPQREEVYTKLCDTLSKLISDVTMQVLPCPVACSLPGCLLMLSLHGCCMVGRLDGL